MRLIHILTATTVAVVMACTVVLAQENFLGRPVSSMRAPFGTAAKGDTEPKNPKTIPGVKNYYDALFGNGASAATRNPSELQNAAGTSQRGSGTLRAGFDDSGPQPSANDPRGAESEWVSTSENKNPFEEATPSEAPVAGMSGNEGRATVAEPIVPEPTVEAPLAPTGIGSLANQASEDVELDIPVTKAPAEEMRSQDRRSVPTLDVSAAHETTERLSGMYVTGPAAVGVHWERHGEVSVGREHGCSLLVANSGASAAEEVVVEAFLPAELNLVSADPRPAQTGDRLTWTIPTLAAGASQRINLTVLPSQQGDLQISAFVRFTEASATTLAVREPQLKLEVKGPAEVPIGETIAQEIMVSNPGTGTTDDVAVEVHLPDGLEHAKGRTLTMPVGSLAAGQSQVIRVAMFATAGGEQTVHVRATGGIALEQEASATVMVASPILALETEGPGLRFVGRDAVYRVRVVNSGGAVANNVRVVHSIPAGFQLIRADKGGTFEPATSEVVWYVGRLEPGQNADFAVELKAISLGEFEHRVSATSEGGAGAETTMATTVDGTASLVVEVLDLDDPVEVGSETAYEVRVRNEGTKSASNVAIECHVPEGVAALSARGPTAHQGDSRRLTFAPIGELPPGKTALYRVIVQGTGAGKHRFRVRLTSDSIDEPLVHEELTYFYAD